MYSARTYSQNVFARCLKMVAHSLPCPKCMQDMRSASMRFVEITSNIFYLGMLEIVAAERLAVLVMFPSILRVSRPLLPPATTQKIPRIIIIITLGLRQLRKIKKTPRLIIRRLATNLPRRLSPILHLTRSLSHITLPRLKNQYMAPTPARLLAHPPQLLAKPAAPNSIRSLVQKKAAVLILL